jgi:hypothetical protein
MSVPKRYVQVHLFFLLVFSMVAQSFSQEYVLVGCNDLGMHCANQDFSKIAVLPPYNNVTAQLILKAPNQLPQIVTSGYKIEYSIPNNTYSVGKTNFWTYAQQLFGLASPLPDNIGLTGKGLTGVLDSSGAFFSAHGIPITPFADSDHVNEAPYQLIHLVAKKKSDGSIVATTDVVIPVSNEVGCVQSGCHSSAQAILNAHESVTGFNRNGPVLCASCHASPALGTVGIPEAGPFSQRIHEKHQEIAGPSNDISTCYKCHPGPKTQCLRDIMGKNPTNPLVCQNCHGPMSNVASTIAAGRRPWLDEPKCGDCHGTAHAENTGKLFRQSTGHGGLFCSACHGSPHAIQPTVQPNDNIQNIRLQGYAGTLSKCSVCHVTPPNGTGPHGLVDTTSIILAAPVLTNPSDRSTGIATNPLFNWDAVSSAQFYYLQVSADSFFSSTIINDSSITLISKKLNSLSNYQLYFWRVRAKNTSSISSWSPVWRFTTGAGSAVAFNVTRRWNLVSLPINQPDRSVGTLFPNASTSAFDYTPGLGYHQDDSLKIGNGYWLKFPSAEMVSFIGAAVNIETVAVKAGWNLIGSISEPIPVGSITSIPPGIVTSNFFGYSNNYVRADTIYPGEGYWVKVTKDGSLILNSNPVVALGKTIQIIPSSDEPPPPPGSEQFVAKDIPTEYSIVQSYPNPFNPTTTITYALPLESQVIVKIYDLLGKELATLVEGQQGEGYRSVEWNASNETSGIYLCRFEAVSTTDPGKKFSQVRKLLLLK